MDDELGHYAALGLPPGAPIAQVRARFRLLAKRLHPDVHGGDHRHLEQFRRIHEAYAFLTDPRRKAASAAPPPTPGPYWVSAGTDRPVPRTAAAPSADRTRRRRRIVLGRAARARLAAALTWTLAAGALFLLGAVLRTPHADAALVRRSIVPQAAPPTARHRTAATAPVDALPVPTSAALLTEPYHNWMPTPVLHDALPDTRDPVVNPRYEVGSRYQAAPTDTHTDAVNPNLTLP